MELKLKTDAQDHIDKYLRVWNGLMGLTKKEFSAAKALISLHTELKNAGISEPYLSEMVFSSSKLKKIKEDLGLNNSAWYTIKKSLIAKKVIRESEEALEINPRMIPQEVLTFKFEIVDGSE